MITVLVIWAVIMTVSAGALLVLFLEAPVMADCQKCGEPTDQPGGMCLVCQQDQP